MTPGPEHVLFVCTGNLCRSPMAEALLRRRLDERGVDGVVVGSAGTRALWSGATATAVEVVGEMGANLEGHRAQPADRGVVMSADLVVAMTTDHVMDLVYEASDVGDRVFKLTELARRVEELGPRGEGESLAEYVARLGEGRSEKPWVDSRTDADVTDPMGESADFYRRIALQIDGHLERAVPFLWPVR